MFSFNKDTKVFIYNKEEDSYYLVNLIAALSVNQRYADKEYLKKTIHNQDNMSDLTITSKTDVAVNFDTYCSSSYAVESEILKWFGFSGTGSVFSMNLSGSESPKRDLLVLNALGSAQDPGTWTDTGVNIYIKDVEINSININISSDSLLAFSLELTGSEMSEYTGSIPDTYVYQSGITPPAKTTLLIGAENISPILDYSVSISKDVKRLNQKTIQDVMANQYYTNKNTVLSSFSLTGNISSLAKDFKFDEIRDSMRFSMENNFALEIGQASVTSTTGPAAMYTANYNYKALNTSSIEFTIGGKEWT